MLKLKIHAVPLSILTRLVILRFPYIARGIEIAIESHFHYARLINPGENFVRHVLVLLLLCLIVPAVHAENWPQWRGPSFNGSSTESGLPESWSKTENVVWAAPLPGPSAATPIVWDDKVFVSSTDAKTKDLLAICIDRKTGKELWRKTVAVGVIKASPTNRVPTASPSPVTDGKSVFFTFGSGDMVAYDMDGKQLWERNLAKDFGALTYMHGYSSSPLLYKERLYLSMLRRDRASEKGAPAKAVADGELLDSFLLAIDPKTGKDVWKQIRKGDGKDGAQEAYTTALPFEFGGRSEVVVSGVDVLTGHNPETGEQLWRWGTMLNPSNSRTVVSALAAGDMLIASGSQKMPVYAVKGGAKGDVGDNQLAWKHTEFPANVCTPLFYNGSLYMVDGHKKILSCLDPKSGAVLWKGTLPGTAFFSASPTGSDGKIYMINEVGDVTIAAAGNEFKILHNFVTDEGPCYSTIVVAQRQVFIRTAQNLYCIARK